MLSVIFGNHVVIIIITVIAISLVSVVRGLSFQFNVSVRRTQIDRGSRRKYRGISIMLYFGEAQENVSYNLFFSPNIFRLTRFGTGALGGKDIGTLSVRPET
jgi:hypothetical protein